MKALLIYFILTSTALATNRLQEHNKASETFLNWHFFENGRGMTISPNMSRYLWMIQKDHEVNPKSVNNFLEQRYGFNFHNGKLLGVFNVQWKKMDVGVLGCTGCHSGKAAGRVIAGLGNKIIDSYQIGTDMLKVQRWWGLAHRNNSDYQYIHEKSINFSKVISDKNLSNLVRGVVSDSTIKTFFYKDHGIEYPKDMGRAQVKVPHLWGIKQKRKAGVFNDGSLSGDGYGWIFGAELFASDSGEHLRAVLPKIKWLTDEVLGNLLPPPYPFKINNEKAKLGKNLFKNNCMSCHGDHLRDSNNHPIYTAPKVIPKEIVKTDNDKLLSISEEFVSLVETSSLSDILSFKEENIQKGYFAPKLWGIWSRFPYTHNASIPSLYHMMSPPKERPIIFNMKDAGEEYRFDKHKVGLTTFNKDEYERALRSAKRGSRNIYYTKREGLSNDGHYFAKSFDKLSERDKLNIIEYLKTL